MRRIILLLLISACAMSNIAYAKIVKWVDSKGVTHYGDKLPPQEAGRSNSVLNNSGMVVKKNEPSINTAAKAEADQKLAEQSRIDSSLLASYSSEDEIDLAKNRNTKADETALDGLNRYLKTLNASLLKNIQTVADLQKRKQKVPAGLVDEIKITQAEVKKTLANIETTKKSIADISLRYDNEKKRYAELKPRSQSLNDIKVKQKDLAELEAWRNDAQVRLNKYQKEAVYYKRAGTPTPSNLVANIQQATDELTRAEGEINVAKAGIKKHEQAFSK
jgi:hypothetical protein